MNNVMTAGRMNTFMSCMRKHFWSHEVGLKSDKTFHALKFGSAWARATEARWKGADYDTALAAAIPEGIELDEYSCATLAALLAGYYDHYGPIETFGHVLPEAQFKFQIEGGFTAEGVMDGLGELKDGRKAIIEGKTTSDSLDANSDYWNRLMFNVQIEQYIDAAEKVGQPVDVVFYDVVRKPMIKPKEIFDLDSEGRKIVVDQKGKRVFAKKKVESWTGKGRARKMTKVEIDDETKPRQSADKKLGHSLKSHKETPDEFCDRLYKDTMAWPDFYFARREIPVLEDRQAALRNQRSAIVRLIQFNREAEDFRGRRPQAVHERDPEAWPRHVSSDTCDFCSYKSFCLQGITVDISNPPAGFSIQPFNPELHRSNNQI